MVEVQNLECVTVQPKMAHQYSVIWMHGLGADGYDFQPFVPELKIPDAVGAKFVFPHAPVMPLSAFGGQMAPAWFDFEYMDFKRNVNEEHINNSVESIQRLIDKELDAGIEPENIIVAGFSQGGVMALYAGLRNEQKLGGILALSTFIPSENFWDERAERNKDIPIFMAHGTRDPVVDFQYAKVSYEVLKKNNANVEWKEYPMEHSLHPNEVWDISHWFKKRFGIA